MIHTFSMLPHEYWRGGSIDDGTLMPFSSATRDYERDFRIDAPNQTTPLHSLAYFRRIPS